MTNGLRLQPRSYLAILSIKSCLHGLPFDRPSFQSCARSTKSLTLRSFCSSTVLSLSRLAEGTTRWSPLKGGCSAGSGFTILHAWDWRWSCTVEHYGL